MTDYDRWKETDYKEYERDYDEEEEIEDDKEDQ
jgi:hypothetical protein